MSNTPAFEVVIIGGSYAGLSAAMALGRALRTVLVIDSGNPCNQQTPHSHNFITQDGVPPHVIADWARAQVRQYSTVSFLHNTAINIEGSNGDFYVDTPQQRRIRTKKILFATGIKDLIPPVPGFSECWGISVIHCPYCHGYEYRGQSTGLLMNGDAGADFATFIHHWSADLTLFTNGPSTLSAEKYAKVIARKITIVEKEIRQIHHQSGKIAFIEFVDGTQHKLDALYARPPFEQQCKLPEELGCKLTQSGHIQVDEMKKTNIPGIFAAGDNTGSVRSVANAVGAGNGAGAFINHELINEMELATP